MRADPANKRLLFSGDEQGLLTFVAAHLKETMTPIEYLAYLLIMPTNAVVKAGRFQMEWEIEFVYDGLGTTVH